MKTVMKSAGSAFPFFVVLALTLAPGIGLSTAFSGEDPKAAWGFGETKAEPSITFNKLKGGTKAVKSFGKKDLGAIGDTVGNRITFAFSATKDAEGKVQGQMFFTDHTLNLSINSDVVKLIPHPKFSDPVGIKAHGLNYSVRLISSKTSVVVNGKPQPAGWTAWNTPVFDGDKDIVCFELKDPTGKKVYQWIGFVSAGDVKTK